MSQQIFSEFTVDAVGSNIIIKNKNGEEAVFIHSLTGEKSDLHITLPLLAAWGQFSVDDRGVTINTLIQKLGIENPAEFKDWWRAEISPKLGKIENGIQENPNGAIVYYHDGLSLPLPSLNKLDTILKARSQTDMLSRTLVTELRIDVGTAMDVVVKIKQFVKSHPGLRQNGGDEEPAYRELITLPSGTTIDGNDLYVKGKIFEHYFTGNRYVVEQLSKIRTDEQSGWEVAVSYRSVKDPGKLYSQSVALFTAKMKPVLQTYDIWLEGYRDVGSDVKAERLGEGEGYCFAEACKALFIHLNMQPLLDLSCSRPQIIGRGKLYDNETEARYFNG